MSNRVPFGTGRAILEAFQNKKVWQKLIILNFLLKEWVDNIKRQDLFMMSFQN